MRSIWMLAVGAVVLGGCVHKGSECSTDGQCEGYERCDVDLGVCGLRPCQQDTECGSGAICGSADHCLPTTGCAAACGSNQWCVLGACSARYSGIEVLAPVGQTNSLQMTARLTLAANGRPGSETSLAYSITGTTAASGTLEKNGEVFEGTWEGGADGTYGLTVTLPGTSLSKTVNFTLDRTPPQLSFRVPTAPARRSPGSATEATEVDPGLAGAFKRDEKVWITVEGSADLAPGSVVLRTVGSDGVQGGALAVDGGLNCGGNYCGAVEVDLSVPVFQTARGEIGLLAEAQDPAGNVALADGGVAVTRLKWIYAASASHEFVATPAITAQGRVVAGTRLGSLGEVYSLRPNGVRDWVSTTGAVVASPVVGAPDGGLEPIYVAANTGATASALLLLRGDTGASRSICPHPTALIEGSPALTQLQAFDDSSGH
ncbi:MAG: hypothetical protein M3Y59_13240, partial [Myxococcota bacterium]|nr:hypothetical protein [Myxococcota bacterium]